VLLDTLLVRLLLLPAILRLLGLAAWWTPRLLGRLPQGLRLRHDGSPDRPAPQPAPLPG
jgi:uncharacterized membrane protein YdfJ with MMPL/SSD domain